MRIAFGSLLGHLLGPKTHRIGSSMHDDVEFLGSGKQGIKE